MNGYWNAPEQTAEALRGGWLRTGDLAVRDERRLLHIVDRKKDMIISGGFNVYPREIEDVLATHAASPRPPSIGVPDDQWGEAVTAFVVPGPARGRRRRADRAGPRAQGPARAPKPVEIVSELPTTRRQDRQEGAARRALARRDRNVH